MQIVPYNNNKFIFFYFSKSFRVVDYSTHSLFSTCFYWKITERRNGVVARASALLLVDLGFIPLVESYQKTFKNGILSFPAWR